MSTEPRVARLRALAKINLGLKVLNKRPDGYHELRTIFQTISVGDRLTIAFTPGRRSEVILHSDPEIPDNLVTRAAQALQPVLRRSGRVEMWLEKVVPMGSGLGGGSADAAAVLLALPVLAGREVPLDQLIDIGGQLGSDIPFFLYGGTALGLGRGTELYPLPDALPAHGLLIAPGIHVSTAAAYGGLGRGLTLPGESSILRGLQALARSVSSGLAAAEWSGCENDFEEVVFRQHPQLKSLQSKLKKLGASPAMMTGSGSALFGLFPNRQERDHAAGLFPRMSVLPMALVSQKQYRNFWWKSLHGHMDTRVWPPRSRYAQ